MFRLTILTEPITDREGKVRVPAGKRQLQLRITEDAVAKFQVRRELSDKIPTYIYEPTWAKLCKVLNKTPSWLTLFGLPGVGKTTLVTSMVEDVLLEVHDKPTDPKGKT
jgi:Holliday junction resolvasome RuvABC ATP-dependent DNA helicase subunit